MSGAAPTVDAVGADDAEQLSLPGVGTPGTLGAVSAAEALDEQPLAATTFVVVDLETTGGAGSDAITEVGAVKVRGGRVLGEFATLVDPRRGIPPRIAELTGITTAMVRDAPPIEVVLPMLWEFAGFGGSDTDTVLVAHNAGFDVGFLRSAAERCAQPWPNPPVLCTVRLARRILPRDEAPSVRLAALARLFGVSNQPTHRALDDARATVEVLHGLIERVGNQGVRTYGDLRGYRSTVTAAQRRKRVLAAHLPPDPGVYLFRAASGEVLYIGTATNLRRRVGQYFTGADPRVRMTEMVRLADRVDHVACAHRLEAGVAELRLLAAHAPPYNRRSKFPRRWWWLVLSAEPFPRLSAVRAPHHDRAVGPFRSRVEALATAELLAQLTGLRTCTRRLARSAVHHCPPHELAGCPTPDGTDRVGYAAAVQRAAALIDGADDAALAAGVAQVESLAAGHRYERAARLRDRLATAVEMLDRGQRLRALAAVPEMVAAAPDGAGGWHLAVIRYGRLAAAGSAPRGVPPLPVVDALRAAAQTVLVEAAPLGGALVEETALIVRWLSAPGVRLVRVDGDQGWSAPRAGAGRWSAWAATARSARLAAEQAPARAGGSSELLTEPHPTREQLFGRAGVDRRGRAAQPVLPGRQPLRGADQSGVGDHRPGGVEDDRVAHRTRHTG